jgi:hypothetical protein
VRQGAQAEAAEPGDGGGGGRELEEAAAGLTVFVGEHGDSFLMGWTDHGASVARERKAPMSTRNQM